MIYILERSVNRKYVHHVQCVQCMIGRQLLHIEFLIDSGDGQGTNLRAVQGNKEAKTNFETEKQKCYFEEKGNIGNQKLDFENRRIKQLANGRPQICTFLG